MSVRLQIFHCVAVIAIMVIFFMGGRFYGYIRGREDSASVDSDEKKGRPEDGKDGPK